MKKIVFSQPAVQIAGGRYCLRPDWTAVKFN